MGPLCGMRCRLAETQKIQVAHRTPNFSFVQIENLFQVTSLWRILRADRALHMGVMCPGQYWNLSVFFTNLMTLFRDSQVVTYFETEDLVFQVTVNEYMEMSGTCPV
jgi:hypothetical protein